jgi:DNA-binding response OmpR family regulator
MTPYRTSSGSRRMLVVEDEPSVLSALKKYFTRDGFDVDCASELEEAEALIATSRYALVIADLRLSYSYAVEGLGILRFVRQHSRGTRVIILTAYATPDVQQRAEVLGADAFLRKPLLLPEIAATVHRLAGEQL